MLPTWLFLFLLAQTPQLHFEQRLAAIEAREIVEVPAEVRLVSEKGLPKDALRSEREVPARGRTRDQPIGDLGEQGQRGLRLLAFLLQPGEKATFTLKALDAGKVQVSLAPPAKPDGMSEEIQRLNRIPAPMRARGLEIRNRTSEVYGLVVKLSGYSGYPYSLEIERAPAKP